MISPEVVEAVILKALSAVNAERAPAPPVAVTPTTPLFGTEAELDSLELVSLIVDVETTLNAEHGLSISLADDRAMSRAESPYTSVATLKQYVLELARGG